MNFLVFYLCDHDYSEWLYSAVEEGLASGEMMQPQQWRNYVLIHILSMWVKRGIIRDNVTDQDLTTTAKYLGEKLQVTYKKKFPTADHDGASVCIDLHTKSITRF